MMTNVEESRRRDLPPPKKLDFQRAPVRFALLLKRKRRGLALGCSDEQGFVERQDNQSAKGENMYVYTGRNIAT
jgi:hypothetical protein